MSRTRVATARKIVYDGWRLSETPVATILLVDSEKIIRTLVRVALKKHNYEVLEAGSASRALALARRRRDAIDLLVTELSLPKTSGVDLAETLAASHPNMRAVFLSRFPRPARLEECARNTGIPVVREPFDMKTLLSQVSHALGARPEEAQRKPPKRSENSAGRERRARAES
jgi:DNA-binding NtrC family response regulator